MMDDIKSFVSSTNSSPWSEGESRYETPGTALTRLSPTTSQDKNTSKIHVIPQQPPPFSLHAVSTLHQVNGQAAASNSSGTHDPFTTASGTYSTDQTSTGLRLSPTAATFMPLGPTKEITTNCEYPKEQREFSASDAGCLPTAVGYLTATSVPDVDGSSTRVKSYRNHYSMSTATLPSLYGNVKNDQNRNSATFKVSQGQLSFSTSTGCTRYLKIEQVSRTANVEELNIAFNEPTFKIPKLVIISELESSGMVYAQFTDIRDARNASSVLPKAQIGWSISFASSTEFHTVLNAGPTVKTTDYEGQVIASAHCEGPSHAFEMDAVFALIKDLLQSVGELMAYEVPVTSFPILAVHAEYYDMSEAEKALRLNGIKLAGVTITIVPYVLSPLVVSTMAESACGPVIIGQDDDEIQRLMGDLNSITLDDPSRSSGSISNQSISESSLGHSYHAGSGFQPRTSAELSGMHSQINVPVNALKQRNHPQMNVSQNMLQANGFSQDSLEEDQKNACNPRSRLTGIFHEFRTPPKQGSRQNNEYASVHHNVVDIDRICQGLDVRTTIMLRNIPNKIDQSMLKEIVDETSYGKYDFMYLRIDFANNCNVGYAFINFEDPWFIIDFVRARAGRRWNRFNSDKVAEVSYATIQGKDCLVQKFRNSSVMLEHPSFRPKIFHTGPGPLNGKEDIFPEPDNPSKMRRSVENAEHVGLFAPRAGQQFRDEQRRRRSQYDRGTRLAEIEDSIGSSSHQRHMEFLGRRSGPSIEPSALNSHQLHPCAS